MCVRWLRTALRNLDHEATYIAADDPKPANLVVRRILDAVALLSEQPGPGRPGRLPGTRELLIPRARYIGPYRVRSEAVEIPRVCHSSRKPLQRD